MLFNVQSGFAQPKASDGFRDGSSAKPAPKPAAPNNKPASGANAVSEDDPFGKGVPASANTAEVMDHVRSIIDKTKTVTGSNDVAPPSGKPRVQPNSQSTSSSTTSRAPNTNIRPQNSRAGNNHGVRGSGQQRQGKGILSVVVNAYPESHLSATLQTLRALQKNKQVTLGQVVVLGLSEGLSKTLVAKGAKGFTPEEKKAVWKNAQSEPPVYKTLRSFGFAQKKQTTRSAILGQSGAESSPVWVVSRRGKIYLYEGVTTVDQHFGEKGNFLRAANPFLKDRPGRIVEHQKNRSQVNFDKTAPNNPLLERAEIWVPRRD